MKPDLAWWTELDRPWMQHSLRLAVWFYTVGLALDLTDREAFAIWELFQNDWDNLKNPKKGKDDLELFRKKYKNYEEKVRKKQ